MAKKDKQTDVPSVQRDDALFETLGKNKKRKRRIQRATDSRKRTVQQTK